MKIMLVLFSRLFSFSFYEINNRHAVHDLKKPIQFFSFILLSWYRSSSANMDADPELDRPEIFLSKS
jgi:hypothetical protein